MLCVFVSLRTSVLLHSLRMRPKPKHFVRPQMNQPLHPQATSPNRPVVATFCGPRQKATKDSGVVYSVDLSNSQMIFFKVHLQSSWQNDFQHILGSKVRICSIVNIQETRLNRVVNLRSLTTTYLQHAMTQGTPLLSSYDILNFICTCWPRSVLQPDT